MSRLLLSITSALVGVLTMAPASFAGEMSNLRGKRYGEVMLGKGGLIAPSEFDVYNTIGLNDCPEELWSKLDSDKIKAETGAACLLKYLSIRESG